MVKQCSQPPTPPAVEPEVELSLEETGARAPRAPPAPEPRALQGNTAGGYDPYDLCAHQPSDSARSAELKPRPKPKDLRRLSEWIQVRQRVDTLKQDDPESK